MLTIIRRRVADPNEGLRNACRRGDRGPPATAAASPAHVERAFVTTANLNDPFAAHIAEAAQRFSIPATWIRAVMRAESAGDVRAVSSAGAMGLMQIMPKTWSHLRARHRLGLDFYNQRDNILAGSAYLREMHDRCGSRDFLATYHAGPGRYEEHLTTGRTLPAETRAYVAALALLVENEPVDSAVVAVASPQSSIRATFQSTRRNQLGSRSPIASRATETQADRPSRRKTFNRHTALKQPVCAAYIFGKATMTSLVFRLSVA